MDVQKRHRRASGRATRRLRRRRRRRASCGCRCTMFTCLVLGIVVIGGNYLAAAPGRRGEQQLPRSSASCCSSPASSCPRSSVRQARVCPNPRSVISHRLLHRRWTTRLAGIDRTMSSRQCRGASGSSPWAAVMVTSAPHTAHRYRRFTGLDVVGVGLGRRRELELAQHRRADHVDRQPAGDREHHPQHPPEHASPWSHATSQSSRSMIVAFAMPPPSHMVWSPKRPPESLELVQQRGHEARARAAERVTERDRAAVDVHPLRIGVQLVLPGEHDARERLVDLDAGRSSSSVSFPRSSTFAVAGIGAVSMSTGSEPTTANAWKRARGASPSRSRPPRSSPAPRRRRR